jgi:hypothetical protein
MWWQTLDLVIVLFLLSSLDRRGWELAPWEVDAPWESFQSILAIYRVLGDLGGLGSCETMPRQQASIFCGRAAGKLWAFRSARICSAWLHSAKDDLLVTAGSGFSACHFCVLPSIPIRPPSHFVCLLLISAPSCFGGASLLDSLWPFKLRNMSQITLGNLGLPCSDTTR